MHQPVLECETLLERLRGTRSILDKRAILEAKDTEATKFMLDVVFNYAPQGYDKVLEHELYAVPLEAPLPTDVWWIKVKSFFNEEVPSTATERRKKVEYILASSPRESAKDLFICMLIQDLKAGVQIATMEKVFPDRFVQFKVQLAKPFKDEEFTPGITSEPKLDGIRAIYIDGKYLSRYGKPLRGPEIECPPEWVLDGELQGVDFQDTLSTVRVGGEMKYFVFDKIPRYEWEAKNFNMSYKERQRLGPQIIPGAHSVVRVDCLTKSHVFEVFRQHLNAGFEGSILKRNVPYELHTSTKRSYSWMKVKPTTEMDVRVLKVYPGPRGGLILQCITPGNKIFEVGSGFSEAEEARILEDPQSVFGRVFTIIYQELSKDGIPRFARFDRWRPDKERL